MAGRIVTTDTGVQEVTSSRISWEMEFPDPGLDGNTLITFDYI